MRYKVVEVLLESVMITLPQIVGVALVLRMHCFVLSPNGSRPKTLGILKNGKLCSADFDMNLFRDAILRVNFWTSLMDEGSAMLMIALVTFLHSISCTLAHFLLSLRTHIFLGWVWGRISEDLWMFLGDLLYDLSFFSHDYYIIDIGQNVSAYLVVEDFLRHSCKGWSLIF